LRNGKKYRYGAENGGIGLAGFGLFTTFGAMYHLIDYIYLAEYIAPACSALSCAVLLLLSYGHNYTHTEVRIKKIAIFYLCASFFSWTATSAYLFFPEAFVLIQSLLYLSLLYAQVFLYRLFHLLTGTNNRKRFSPLHYLIPAVICVVLAVWSFFVPYEVQLDIVTGRGRVIPQGYGAYSLFFMSKLPVRLLYCAFYTTLTFWRLAKYYKRINASSSLVRKPAGWIFLLVLLTVTSAVVSTVAGLMRSAGLYLSLFGSIASVALFAQHIVLTFTVIRRRYILYITFPGQKQEALSGETAGADEKKPRKPYSRTDGRLLTRRGFETYIKEHKPYLDASFKITNLVEAMAINRTYLSKFVNRTYGMNFNRYVNCCRLREVDRLIHLPSNRDRALRELVCEAGFADMKHYRRTLATEKEEKTDDGNDR
jgi:AraC-like DNA-binding protein